MEYKAIPTDNIYKSFFFIGIILLFVFPYYLLNDSYEIGIEVFEFEGDSKRLEIELEYDLKILDEYNELHDELLAQLKETAEIKETLLSKKKSQNHSITKLDELRSQIAVSNSLVNKLQDKINELKQPVDSLNRNIKIKAANNAMTRKIIKEKLERQSLYNSFIPFFLYLGSILMIIGLINWIRIQLLSERYVYKELGEEYSMLRFFNFIGKWFKKKK